MSNNPEDWAKSVAGEMVLPHLTKKVDGKTVQLSREESDAIYAEWDKNYKAQEAAKLDPKSYPLTNVQFHAMVDFLGVDEQIRKVFDAMPASMAKSMAVKRYENSTEYNRDDELLNQVAADPAIALSAEEIDKAWMEAKDL